MRTYVVYTRTVVAQVVFDLSKIYHSTWYVGTISLVVGGASPPISPRSVDPLPCRFALKC